MYMDTLIAIFVGLAISFFVAFKYKDVEVVQPEKRNIYVTLSPMSGPLFCKNYESSNCGLMLTNCQDISGNAVTDTVICATNVQTIEVVE